MPSVIVNFPGDVVRRAITAAAKLRPAPGRCRVGVQFCAHFLLALIQNGTLALGGLRV